MARRGHQSMAFTACFASPLFNLLVGLGTALLVARESEGAVDAPLVDRRVAAMIIGSLSGALAVLAACWTQGGRVPRGFSWVLWAIYALALLAAVA